MFAYIKGSLEMKSSGYIVIDINNKFIGGYNDLLKLKKENKL